MAPSSFRMKFEDTTSQLPRLWPDLEIGGPNPAAEALRRRGARSDAPRPRARRPGPRPPSLERQGRVPPYVLGGSGGGFWGGYELGCVWARRVRANDCVRMC